MILIKNRFCKDFFNEFCQTIYIIEIHTLIRSCFAPQTTHFHFLAFFLSWTYEISNIEKLSQSLKNMNSSSTTSTFNSER